MPSDGRSTLSPLHDADDLCNDLFQRHLIRDDDLRIARSNEWCNASVAIIMVASAQVGND
jgi:hypothetical protein